MTIAATSELLMGVIADFPAYPAWVDTVRSAQVIETGPDGRAIRVQFALEAGPIKDSYVLSYQWHADRQVRWEIAERGSVISQLSGAYLLADRGTETEVTYQLSVGLAVPMLGMFKRRAEKAIIDAALKGLASRAREVAEGEAL